MLGDITTVIPKRKKPKGAREAFQAAGKDDSYELVDIKVEDLASVLLRFENGARAFPSARYVPVTRTTAARDLPAQSSRCDGGRKIKNELWIGNRDKANELLQKDPSLIEPDARDFAHLPGGHQEGWPDANFNVMRTIYGYIASGKERGTRPAAMATFEDGYRANAIVETIIESAKQGGVWTKVNY